MYIIILDESKHFDKVEFKTARIAKVVVGSINGNICEVTTDFGYFGFRHVTEVYDTLDKATMDLKNLIGNRKFHWEREAREATAKADRYTNMLAKHY